MWLWWKIALSKMRNPPISAAMQLFASAAYIKHSLSESCRFIVYIQEYGFQNTRSASSLANHSNMPMVAVEVPISTSIIRIAMTIAEFCKPNFSVKMLKCIQLFKLQKRIIYQTSASDYNWFLTALIH